VLQLSGHLKLNPGVYVERNVYQQDYANGRGSKSGGGL
jgi:hypothetical protein